MEARLEEHLAALVDRALGAEIAAVEPVTPGLGARRFLRLRLRGATGGSTPERAIARIDHPEDPAIRPAGTPPEPALEPLRSFLEAAGIPVPASLGRDPERGIELLEDVGTHTLETAAAGDEATRQALYAEALALVPRLQRLRPGPHPVPAFSRRLDRSLFAHKASRVVDWLLPWALGREPTAGEARTVCDAFDAIATICERAPQRLAHRDYKAANIHLRPGRPPGERLVLIDLQGAFLAPPEYDAVCLLRDPHVPLPEAEVGAQLAALRPSLPDALGEEDLLRRFALLTLTRVGKDLALYRYAAAVRGDRRYLAFVPNAARSLRSAAASARAEGGPIAQWAAILEQLPESPPCGP